MRKWIPFIVIIIIIFVLVIFLFFTGQTNEYIPETSNPDQVYKEACAGCHGERGKGEGVLYPDLAKESLEVREIIDVVRNGELFMPSFPHIPDSTLQKLALYVSEKQFLND